jgi:ferredoxin-NADP reductase
MAVQTIKLLKRIDVAEGTTAFTFQRPEGFEFKAGQSGDFTLVNPPETDGEGNTRAFSFASPPHEPDITITTRMRNTAFKRVLKSMKIGSELTLDGPFGAMTLHNNATRPAVLLAGGIGITPFRSMILRASHEHLPHRITLFYANRNQAAAFLAELYNQEKRNANFKLVATVDEPGKSVAGWKGETGHIDKNMLMKYVAPLNGPIYYLAGPPSMVTAMQKLLNEAGVDDDDIKLEAFSGY